MQARQTDDPLIGNIFLAENINLRNGGALVQPWALDNVPEDYRIAYIEIIRAAGSQRETAAYAARSEQFHAAFRRNHPTYRKYSR